MVEDEPKNLLHQMLRVRRLEEICAELYTQEKIRGFLHLYIGEEAVVTGVMSLLNPQDNVMATYREHGHALLKGVSARSILAEMFGKVDGTCKGRGGSMHLISSKDRFFGGNAIVAAGIPQAVGLALATKKMKENRRTVCFFGEGAMAEGVSHEALNMAELWKIPVLFCCENNYFAMGTALARSQAQVNLTKIAEAHNVTAQIVDGMNVFEVIRKTTEALEYMRSEGRPYFLEFRTYRFRPHSMFDPELYRSKDEVREWKEKDPIKALIDQLMKSHEISESIIKDLEKNVEQEMQDAMNFAENSQIEPPQDLEKYLYENDLSRGLERRA